MRETEDSGKERHIPDEEFLTLREAARLLRISERTMRELLQSGEVHGHKLRGQWRIPRAEMQRLRAPGAGHPPMGDASDWPDAPYGESV